MTNTKDPAGQDTHVSDVQGMASDLEAAFSRFQAEHPELVEAMAVMNLSFADYLEALTALQEPSLTSDNNVLAT